MKKWLLAAALAVSGSLKRVSDWWRGTYVPSRSAKLPVKRMVVRVYPYPSRFSGVAAAKRAARKRRHRQRTK